MMPLPRAQLYLFDLDGTLAKFKTGEILENVKETIAQLSPDAKAAIVTNQGGTGLRYWMEFDGFGGDSYRKYPTESQSREHVKKVMAELGVEWPVYFAFAYQSSSKGNWSPTPDAEDTEDIRCWNHNWRKPDSGMLEQALQDFGIAAADALMCGDWAEDSLAAAKIDVPFIWAHEFFNRPKPEEKMP